MQDVLPGILERPDLLVSDVAQKRRFVEQGQDKLRVVNGELAQE
jgi:hypothetical protein